MGRHAEGFALVKRGNIYTVRFRIAGKRWELSTGESSRAAALEAGRAIYAAAINGRDPSHLKRRRAPSGPDQDLAEVAATWLEEHVAREKTRQLYEKYAAYWVREFTSTANLSERRIAAYFRRRLREVRGKTASNELCALRVFLRWLVETDVLSDVPPLPSITKAVTGTPYAKRRRSKAPELTPEEIEAILVRLPEFAERGRYPVQARFVVAYDTTIRPETLNKLRVPENYSRGMASIELTAEDDKELYGRTVPLTERARRALDSVCPPKGLIFGEHRYGRYLRAAAREVLPPSKAEVFTGQHFRSAAITHYLERTGNLPGVQHLAGHRHTSTTARYVRPSYRAALAVVTATEQEPAGIRGKIRGMTGT